MRAIAISDHAPAQHPGHEYRGRGFTRLARLAGFERGDEERLRDYVELTNLSPSPDGRDLRHRLRDARASLVALIPSIQHRPVLLLGSVVAVALGAQPRPYFVWRQYRGIVFAVVPHPSIANESIFEDVERMRVFLRRTVEQVERGMLMSVAIAEAIARPKVEESKVVWGDVSLETLRRTA